MVNFIFFLNYLKIFRCFHKGRPQAKNLPKNCAYKKFHLNAFTLSSFCKAHRNTGKKHLSIFLVESKPNVLLGVLCYVRRTTKAIKGNLCEHDVERAFNYSQLITPKNIKKCSKDLLKEIKRKNQALITAQPT